MQSSNDRPYYFIEYDKEIHTLTFCLHEDLVSYAPTFSEASLPVRFIRKYFVVNSFEFSVQGNFGINNLTKNLGIVNNYLRIAISIPRQESAGQEANAFRSMQANIYLLTRMLNATLTTSMLKETLMHEDIRNAREKHQHMVYEINVDRERTTGGSGIGGVAI